MNFALALLPIPRHVTPHPRPHQRALGLDVAIGRNIALPQLAAKRPVQQRLKQVLGSGAMPRAAGRAAARSARQRRQSAVGEAFCSEF